MSYSTVFLADGLGVIHVGRDLVGTIDLINGCATIERAPTARALRYVVVDLTAARELRVSTVTMDQVAAQCVRTAAVAPELSVVVIASSPHIFGLARMWEAYSQPTGWRTMVVRGRSEADRWLHEFVPTAQWSEDSELQ